MKATQQLRDEHEGIKIMLSILEQVCRPVEAGGNLNKEHFESILEFLKVFVDKCHHGKEEDLPQNAQGYVSLLRDHIEKENNILFVIADDHLAEGKQEELFKGFERIEVERIGIGKHEEFHGLLKKLSGIYLN